MSGFSTVDHYLQGNVILRGPGKRSNMPGVIDTVIHKEQNMADKLYEGDVFPKITLNLVGGGTVTIPDDFDSKYLVPLFYRGHW